MDARALREKSEAELREELLRLRRAQFELRMQLRGGQLSRNHLIGEGRRDIARVQTVLAERRREART